MNMVTRKELTSSLVLILFGVGYLLCNTKYPLDQWANPGPGVFPLMVGAVLVVLAFYQLIQSIRKPKPAEATTSDERGIHSLIGSLREGKTETKPLIMIAVFILYLMMVRWVGFFVSDFLFVVITSRLMGARDWGRPIALSAGVNIFCYFLFEVWLKLSFPRGFLF
jgi:putative tricarboxylic transport membrane protein